jgi:signal transduction histidine kinase
MTESDIFRTMLPEELDSLLLAALMQQSLLGVALFDSDWAWVHGNPAWREATGIVDKQRTSLFDLLPQLEPVLRPFLRHLATGQSVPRQPMQIDLNDRSVYWELAIIPLRAASKVQGFMMLLDDNTEHVHAQQRLERRIADRAEKLSALYDVIAATVEAPDLRRTLSRSLQRVLAALKCPAGVIYLLDDLNQNAGAATLRPIVQKGITAAMAQIMADAGAATELAKLVMQNESPIVISNIAAHAAFPAAFHQQTSLQTCVVAGMTVRGKSIGLLAVFAKSDRHFGEIELALLDSVADQIGIVVENVYLYKRAEEAAVVEERHRLARELHDSVTQAIYSLTLFTEAGLRLLHADDLSRIEELLHHLNDTSQQALREMRLMLHKLRPPDLEEEGFVGALQQRLDEVETRANVEARLLLVGDLDELPGIVEEHLYRIAQEALNNALKHSTAALLKIQVTADENDITLEIRDDGQGFDVEEARAKGGMGLQNMAERVESLGGDLRIASAPGEGSTVTVKIDLNKLGIAEDDTSF